MNGLSNFVSYCGNSNMKSYDAAYLGAATELPDGEHIVCTGCNRKLKKSSAGFGASWTIPRHKKVPPKKRGEA